MIPIEKVRAYTSQLEQKGLLRTRCISEPNKSSLIHFDSNDYLSLTQDKRIAQAYQEGYNLYPTGSGASMVLSGYHPNHQILEQAFAQALQVDDCLIFSSGYAANLALTGLLGALKIHCVLDKQVHASIYDGLKLADISYTRYLHNDLHDLSQKLNTVPAHSAVLAEGIFSMSGQTTPLNALSAICRPKEHTIFVDEAHSFGVIGPQGRGSVAHHSLTQNEVPLRVIPLGKSFAAQGAVVAGQKEWIVALLQASRSLIYSIALSPALSYGLLKTLDVVMESDQRRDKLNHLIQFFREKIQNSPLQWVDSQSPIQLLQLGCPRLALQYTQKLKQEGFSCLAIRSPTVNLKSTGLRVILNYQHQEKQIHQFFNALHNI